MGRQIALYAQRTARQIPEPAPEGNFPLLTSGFLFFDLAFGHSSALLQCKLVILLTMRFSFNNCIAAPHCSLYTRLYQMSIFAYFSGGKQV
jgi:hypothetical protein